MWIPWLGRPATRSTRQSGDRRRLSIHALCGHPVHGTPRAGSGGMATLVAGAGAPPPGGLLANRLLARYGTRERIASPKPGAHPCGDDWSHPPDRPGVFHPQQTVGSRATVAALWRLCSGARLRPRRDRAGERGFAASSPARRRRRAAAPSSVGRRTVPTCSAEASAHDRLSSRNVLNPKPTLLSDREVKRRVHRRHTLPTFSTTSSSRGGEPLRPG